MAVILRVFILFSSVIRALNFVFSDTIRHTIPHKQRMVNLWYGDGLVLRDCSLNRNAQML